MAAAASSLISTSLEASIFSIPASSKLLRHIHEHQTGIHRIPALSSQKSSGCGGVSCRGRRGGISRRRKRRRSLLVLCLSSISSSGDGGRSCSNSHDGDSEDLHSSEDNSNSSSDDNPQASRSEREHPFLPSQKQQNQRDGETTTARGLEASAAAQSALERAAAYRKTQASVVVPNDESSSDSTTSRSSEAPTKVPEKELEVDDKNKKNNNKAAVVALSAFERAQAYRKQQAEMVAALGGGKEEKNKKKNKSAAKLNSLEEEAAAAAVPNKGEEEEDEGEADEKNKVVEIEIYTRDGIVRRKVSKPETAFSNIRDIKRKGMSDMDFAGLGFADKKSSGTPAGLSQGFTVPTGALPEVEILTRDGAQGKQPQTTTATEETDLYKPRVSTWGVFPRPADISKTYGGGRTIRPGESLETPQEKEAREARTKKLLDDYRHKMGLDIDPELKMQCEKILKQGESLMDRGLLREALVSFESVMEKISFQSEVHGLAALRGAVCMDSLNRQIQRGEACL
ncbi:hypothetical protein BDL97_03G108300 [Sphagnum fallax]|nr:hypothetical protein BDL97_03G108300 [Sphagnum fallax]